MKISDFLAVALKHLRSRLLETIVIVIAIGLGTGVISLALGLRFATEDAIQSAQQQDFRRTIRISSGEEHMRTEEILRVGESFPEPAEFTVELVYDIKENCPAVDYIYTRGITSLQVSEIEGGPPPPDDPEREEWEEKRRESRITVERTFPDELDFLNIKIVQGHNFSDSDIKEGNRVIIIGAGTAARHFPDKNPIGQELEVINDDPFTVIGVLEDLDYDDDIQVGMGGQFERYHNGGFIPYTAYGVSPEKEGSLLDVEVNNISAAVDDYEKVKHANSQIESYLETQFVEGFNVYHYGEAQEGASRALIIAGFVASLGLLIAAINILNLMLARVLRRTKDMGVIKALGSTRRNIFILFLSEALLLGFFGAVLGFFLAFGGEYIINQFTEYLLLTIDYRVFLSAVAISGLISMIFGVYPAIQASGIDPVEALRIE